MRVLVMHVGHVLVRVLQPPMLMSVRVRLVERVIRLVLVVMCLVMNMRMRMRDWAVQMFVLVTLRHVQP